MRFNRVLPLLASGALSTLLLVWVLTAFGGPDPRYVGTVGALGPSGHLVGEAVSIDTVTVVFVAEAGIDYTIAACDSIVAAADTVMVLGVDVPEFRWCNPQFAPDSTVTIANSSNMHLGAGYNAWSRDHGSTSPNGRRTIMFYIDWEKYIPAGSTVLDRSTLRFYPLYDWDVSIADSVCSILMTNPADSLWHSYSPVTRPFMSPAVWTGQGGDGVAQWDPILSSRIENDQWGDVIEWGGNKYSVARIGRDTGEGQEGVPFPMKEVVQGALNGLVNNGISLWRTDSSSTPSEAARHWGAGSDGNESDTPVISITYTTKTYKSRFPNGAEWAFVFSTDDGIQAFNDSMATVFDNFGAHFSPCVIGNKMGTAGRLTWAEVKAMHDNGHDIGCHTYGHEPFEEIDGRRALGYFSLTDLTTVNYTPGMILSELPSSGATAMDSVMCEVNREWMTAQMLADQGVNLSSSNHWMRTLALPYHNWSPLIPRALGSAGYTSMRCASISKVEVVDGDFTHYQEIVTQSWGINGAIGDTLRTGFLRFDNDHELNLMGVPSNTLIEHIVGSETDSTISKAVIENNMWRIVSRLRGKGINVLSTYVHNRKFVLPEVSGYEGMGAVDPQEMYWVLQWVLDNDGCIMSVQEYTAWMKSRATAVDTPPAFGQADPVNCTASERIWYKPWGTHYKPRD